MFSQKEKFDKFVKCSVFSFFLKGILIFKSSVLLLSFFLKYEKCENTSTTSTSLFSHVSCTVKKTLTLSTRPHQNTRATRPLTADINDLQARFDTR